MKKDYQQDPNLPPGYREDEDIDETDEEKNELLGEVEQSTDEDLMDSNENE